ncbi:MAG TPA: trypsin-like peptidase domain-containing protein [Thermoleophilaceae bacterium]|nr:trypsin-like peptidase domain-containing protein [Thermoleophilaceae bacterium]
MTPPSDLWAGGASERPRPRRPRRPGRTHLGLRPPEPPDGGHEPGDDDRWKRWRAPIVAAAVASVLALSIGLVVGAGVFDGGDSDAVVVGGKAGQAGSAGKVYAAAGPAVVSVRVRQGGRQASGTGFLVDGDGSIVTNSHVVGEAERVTVRFDDSGREIPARVRGTDPSSDLAVLDVDRSDVGSRRPLALARSSSVRVGDEVVAIGFPLGLDKTATEGIVSGLERDIQAPNGFQIDRVIQTDAPINPGNSGGPLLDTRGRVVGVNSQIATAGAGASGSIGIGFAVPADAVRNVLPRLKAGERIERPFIGLTSSADPRGGARVRDVTKGGPADQAGLSAAGDVIVGIDGRPVRTPSDVSSAVSRLKPGDSVRVTVRRGGDRRTVRVRLTTRPERLPGGP